MVQIISSLSAGVSNWRVSLDKIEIHYPGILGLYSGCFVGCVVSGHKASSTSVDMC